jgi:hypothetical protein
MSCRIGPNTELERGAAVEQPLSSLEETNSFPEQELSCALLQQALSCVLTHTRFMGSHKLSSVGGR